MRSILERLRLVAALLLTARAAGKQKSTRKATRKKIARPLGARKRTTRPKSARRVAAKPAAKGKPGSAKAAASKKPTVKPAPAAKVESTEPLPKPAAPAGRAILLAPENGKFADSVNPKFRWLSVGGATRYEVAWSDDPNFADGHSVRSVSTEAAVPVEQPLHVGVTYYWRVRGGNEGGWGPWSSAASFRVLTEETA